MNDRLAKYGKLLIHPFFWRGLMHGVAGTIEHDAALGQFNFKTVIDVGANKGQFALYAKWRWPDARVICFEPLAAPRNKLTSVLGGQVDLHSCALGEEVCEASMHVSSRTDSSSLLPLGEKQKTIFSMNEIARQSVPVKRLDDFISRGLSCDCLLKIDVQGFELEVLKGAGTLLPSIDAIYVEVSWTELYEGQALHDEVEILLQESGFKLSGTFNEYFYKNSLIQADLLFVRADK